MISVIIPVLNEEAGIAMLLKRLTACYGVELLVVDGGSSDKTVSTASRFAKVIICGKGRALQMNEGAKMVSGEILLFLHADTVLPDGFVEVVNRSVANGYAGGRFDVVLDNNRVIYQVISFMISLRSRITKVATGDQAIFVKRVIWERLGGFKEMPIMEDIDFMKRLKKEGRIYCAKEKVLTSARRWEQGGVIKTILLMWILKLLYHIGVSPARLALFYTNGR